MGTHPVQVGGLFPPLQGIEWGPRPGEEYVRPGRRPPAPPRVGWPGNLMGLPLAGVGAVRTATASGTTVPPWRRTWDLDENTQGGIELNYDRRDPRRDKIIK